MKKNAKLYSKIAYNNKKKISKVLNRKLGEILGEKISRKCHLTNNDEAKKELIILKLIKLVLITKAHSK